MFPLQHCKGVTFREQFEKCKNAEDPSDNEPARVKEAATELLLNLFKQELQLFCFDFKDHMSDYIAIVEDAFDSLPPDKYQKGRWCILNTRLCLIHNSFCQFMEEMKFKQPTVSPLRSEVRYKLQRFIRNSVGL